LGRYPAIGGASHVDQTGDTIFAQEVDKGFDVVSRGRSLISLGYKVRTADREENADQLAVYCCFPADPGSSFRYR
jgi:hypothetical protein